MRYFVGFVVAMALVALPLKLSAQDGEPLLEEPARELHLDGAAVEVTPSPSPTADGYTLEELKTPVKRAKIGIGASALSLVVGGILAGVALPNLSCESSGTGVGDCPIPGWSLPVFVTGVTLAGGGALGMIATGALLGVRKRKLHELQQARYGRARRAQWDLAHAQLVF